MRSSVSKRVALLVAVGFAVYFGLREMVIPGGSSARDTNEAAGIRAYAARNAQYGVVVKPLVEDLVAGRRTLWEATDLLHEHCKEHFPQRLAAMERHEGLRGTMREKLARTFVNTFMTRLTTRWPDHWPEWIRDKLEWEYEYTQ